MSAAAAPYCVYLITCAPSGKAYVGLTKCGADRRFRAHKYNSARGAGGALYHAIRKYGPEVFAVSVLRQGLTLGQAQCAEIELIAARGTRTPGGYNISLGGDAGATDVVVSPETRAAMSAAHRARQADPELRRRTAHALSGRRVLDETRQKLRAASTGKTQSEETRAKLRAANAGKKQSPETVAKRAASLAGRTATPEARAAMSEAQRGRAKSEQHRAALRAALVGRKPSAETLAKRSATLKGRPKSEEWKAKMRAIWAAKRAADG